MGSFSHLFSLLAMRTNLEFFFALPNPRRVLIKSGYKNGVIRNILLTIQTNFREVNRILNDNRMLFPLTVISFFRNICTFHAMGLPTAAAQFLCGCRLNFYVILAFYLVKKEEGASTRGCRNTEKLW